MDESLLRSIGRLRREYVDETGIPLSIAGIPLLTYPYTDVAHAKDAPVRHDCKERGCVRRQSTILEQERPDEYGSPGPAYGRSLSSRMVRLGEQSFGTTFLMRRALLLVPRWCESRHREKGDPLHADRPQLCHHLINTTIKYALGSGEFVLPENLRLNFYARIIRKVADDSEISVTDAELLLLAAVRFLDQKRTEFLARTAA